MNKLNPLTFALQGSRLIEASAGTGKTFTIAALYVRLVLGHGQADTAFNRPLIPPEILVVTFTDAATKELRSRIRERLAQAAQYFYAGAAENTHPGIEADDFLHELRQSYPPDTWMTHARRLQIAADWMDEAAVSTIHGWCNRMLREHAFHSESLFTQSLEQNQKTLLTEVAQDYWRQFIYPLDTFQASEYLEHWQTPQALLNAIQNLLAHAPDYAAALAPLDLLNQAQEKLAALKQPWHRWLNELRDLIEDARAAKQFQANLLKTNHTQTWLVLLQAWRDDATLILPQLSEKAWERLTPAGMKEIWHDKAQAPTHPALQAIADLRAQISIKAPLLKHAAAWIAQRFEYEQNRRAQMGFDGLLTRLDAALQGVNGEQLAHIIRQQYPVALIDEFQDTDAIQYRIFDGVYRLENHDAQTAVVLIGDPKQAIYTFRGADVYTYLQAKKAVGDRLYSLPTNYRSTQSMVEAVNHCFSSVESRPDSKGAFLFRQGLQNPVPFVAVEAQGRSQTWVVDGQPAAALKLWCMEEDQYTQRSAAICAEEIAQMLQSAAQGQTGFQSGPDSSQPEAIAALRPGDIAILVNNRFESDAIRKALSSQGIRSVYLSESESVYKQAQAQDLRHWLMACANPEDARAVRMALATASLQLDWATLDQFNLDAMAWDAKLLQFKTYQKLWQQQGVLPMVRRMLHDFGVPARLLAQSESGERSLTNLLHLAELLQQASTGLEGEPALIAYLTERINEESAANSPYTMRLESDADLVQVVTIHKSKGLEYPLVFMPFICNTKIVDAKKLPLLYHDADGKRMIALEVNSEIKEKADQERLAEDLRKLYVGLTRARYATWLGLAPLDHFERSAMGYLLGNQLQEGSSQWAADCPHIQKQDRAIDAPTTADAAAITDTAHYPAARSATKVAGAYGTARQAQRSLQPDWRIASYSGLRYANTNRASHTGSDSPESLFQEVALEEHMSPLLLAEAPPLSPSLGLLHDFPRGAAAGVFLHSVLEWACAEGFGRWAQTSSAAHQWPESVQQRVRQNVQWRCQLKQWEQWAEPLTQWLLTYLQQPLRTPAGTHLKLGSLPAESVVTEMEFWLAIHQVDLPQMDALVVAHTLDSLPRPALQPGQLNGMLKGFIDLVVAHDGRYYVIDYKSNRLGESDASYTPEAMRQVVLDNRYELQYVLYLVALHRLLKLRIPDYDYDRHIGGAMYLFLRGHQAPTQGIHAERPPRALIEGLDALFTAPAEHPAA